MILSINKNDLRECKKILKKLRMPHVELGYINSRKSDKKITFLE